MINNVGDPIRSTDATRFNSSNQWSTTRNRWVARRSLARSGTKNRSASSATGAHEHCYNGRYLMSTTGKSVAQKILSRASGASDVEPGRIVDASPDLVMSHTATWRSVDVMKKLGATKLFDPSRIAVVRDHVSPAKTEKYAADQKNRKNHAGRTRERGSEVGLRGGSAP